MMRYILFFISFLWAGMLSAQTIVESLEQKRPGEGTVTIHQSAQIKALIGLRYVPSTAAGIQKAMKTRGFLVQVYAGNNSRIARNEAHAVAEKMKELFPDMPVYTYFQSPRWLCRVGDFKSIEEAHVAMRKLKASGEFKEAAIVQEIINISLE